MSGVCDTKAIITIKKGFIIRLPDMQVCVATSHVSACPHTMTIAVMASWGKHL